MATGGGSSIRSHDPSDPNFSVYVSMLSLFPRHQSQVSETKPRRPQQSRVRREGVREEIWITHSPHESNIFLEQYLHVFIGNSFCFALFVLPCLVCFVETGSKWEPWLVWSSVCKSAWLNLVAIFLLYPQPWKLGLQAYSTILGLVKLILKVARLLFNLGSYLLDWKYPWEKANFIKSLLVNNWVEV